MQSEFSLAELANEAEWRRCAGDVDYFLRNYYYIQHPEVGKMLFDLRDAQTDILRALQAERKIIILKARQIGYTTIVMGYLFWLAFFHDDKKMIVLSRTERLAQEALSRCDYAYGLLPTWMSDRGPKRTADNLLVMPFDNGSAVESYPSQKDPARGRTVYMIVADEFASLDDQDGAWASIEPTTDIGGRVVILSTAKGAGDTFEHFWNGAEAGDNGFFPMFQPWWAVPERDSAWYDQKKRDFAGREHILHQEYPSSAAEAFVRSGNAVFDLEALLLLREQTEDPRVGELKPRDHDGSGTAFTFVDATGGPLQVHELPVRGHRYTMGIDVAEGLAHGDYSVCTVLDTTSGMVAAKWRSHTPPDVLGKDVAWALGHFYNHAFIGVEVNNHGMTTAMAIRDKGYQNLYWRARYDGRSKIKTGSTLGWYTSSQTKPDLIDSLAEGMREDIVCLNAGIIAEMMTYVYNDKGRMSGSPFDDQVISLGLAHIMRRHVSQATWDVDEAKRGTTDWLMRYLFDDDEDEPAGIGAHSVRH